MSDTKNLIEKVKKYSPEVDTDLIKRAYDFASASHINQQRASGEYYISHPLGVAEILAELELDITTIVAGLLHDVVEDTKVTLEEIKSNFGDEVAGLIDGVTKLGQIEFKSREERQAENLRKMLIAMAKDIRVILIKLADRLHNLDTICHLPETKQKLIAQETLEIYAPLAHRLGIFQLKWKLEDLAFAALEPKKYAQVQRTVSEGREEREVYLKTVIETLEKELKAVGIQGETQGRVKHFYSIYQKMIQRGKEFNEIYDLSAVRILVDSVKDCYAALGVVHSMWKPVPGTFKDYIAMPKFNMYQSLHTVVIGPIGRPLEIQIRTKQMHKTAEYGIAAHWRYKEGIKEADEFDERLAWLRQILEWQRELKDPREFMEALKIDLFADEVFVFTPKGDVISLPVEATPIDFAYAIHTDVGNSCIGAKINNQIVPLEYKLQMGDIVEVLTSKSASGPSQDWLSIVKTSRARNKIRQWFSKESKEGSEHLGKELLQKALRRHKLGLSSVSQGDLLGKIAEEYGFLKVEDLFAGIGSGNVSAQQVATKIFNELHKKEEKPEEVLLPLKRPLKKEKADRLSTGVRVTGVEDALVRLARCCCPIPLDDIIGFVTRGRGVSVHKSNCSNVKQLRISSDRLIEVSWGTEQSGAFPVEVQVEAFDRTKLLRDISSTISDCGVNILSASVTTSRNRIAIFKFTFEISSPSHLESILTNIRKVDSVLDTYRVSST